MRRLDSNFTLSSKDIGEALERRQDDLSSSVRLASTGGPETQSELWIITQVFPTWVLNWLYSDGSNETEYASNTAEHYIPCKQDQMRDAEALQLGD